MLHRIVIHLLVRILVRLIAALDIICLRIAIRLHQIQRVFTASGQCPRCLEALAKTSTIIDLLQRFERLRIPLLYEAIIDVLGRFSLG